MSYLNSIPWVIFYITIFICCIPFCVSQKDKVYLNKSILLLQYYILIVFPIFFVGFRGFVFTDWYAYYPFFKNAPTLFDTTGSINNYLGYMHWEKGFIWFAIIFKTFFNNYFLFQFFNFLVDYIILISFFKQNVEKEVAWAIFFLFLFEGFTIEINLLRNSKAMMLFFISIKYLKQRKLLPYVILNTIGVFFHTSALLFLVLYFILPLKINRKFIILLFSIGLIIFILNIQWLTVIFKFLLPYLGFNERLGRIITGYLENSYSRSISIGFIERVASFLLVFHYEKKILKLQQENRIYINAFYFYTMCYLFGSSFAIIYQRVGLLFVFSYWILFPLILKIIPSKDKKILIAIIFLYGLLKNINGNKNILSKYNNYLINEPNYIEYSGYFEQTTDVWKNK